MLLWGNSVVEFLWEVSNAHNGKWASGMRATCRFETKKRYKICFKENLQKSCSDKIFWFISFVCLDHKCWYCKRTKGFFGNLTNYGFKSRCSSFQMFHQKLVKYVDNNLKNLFKYFKHCLIAVLIFTYEDFERIKFRIIKANVSFKIKSASNWF